LTCASAAGAVDRGPDIDLRRQMEDQLRAERLHRRAERRGVGDAQLVRGGTRIQPRSPARGQIINHQHLVTPGQQRIGQVGADETGTACHEYTHD